MKERESGRSPFEVRVDRRAALATLGVASCATLSGEVGFGSADQSSGRRDQGLTQFSEEARNRLLGVLNGSNFIGQIPAAQVRTLAEAERKSVDDLMTDLVPLARTYSRPPLSNFQVGAVGLGSRGDLYLGANMEIPGQALGLTVHAEQAALSTAYMHDERGVSSIALRGAPCGHCRQFMNEFSPEGEIKILVAGNAPIRLSSLLPMAFGPKALGFNGGAFSRDQVDLKLSTSANDDLIDAALSAACRSHAPYTRSYSGIAVATKSGRVYRGAYIENVAFNPSLSPLQTALVSLTLAGESSSAISRVVLVEVSGASISQKAVTEVVLGAIAPAVKVDVATATRRY